VEHISRFFYLFSSPDNRLDARHIRLAGGRNYSHNVFRPIAEFRPHPYDSASQSVVSETYHSASEALQY
jgi:hypothetical protein